MQFGYPIFGDMGKVCISSRQPASTEKREDTSNNSDPSQGSNYEDGLISGW